jgi:hypothetical protein
MRRRAARWFYDSDVRNLSITNPDAAGISDDKDRLMVIVTYNSDLGDAWEHMDVPCYREKYSGQAYRMGINFVMYAMTH